MTALLILALAGAPAHAQEAVDAHGFYLVPSDGDALDLLGTWRPEEQVQGSFGVTGLFEYAKAPLVLYREYDDGSVEREPYVDNLLALNLGATVAAHERVAVALTAPVFFTTVGPDGVAGPAFGDLRLSVPVTVVMDPSGFTLSAIPFADLPSGADGRFLGNSKVAGGGLLAAGYNADRFAFSGNVGYRALPDIAYENLRGGDKLLLAMGGGYAVNDWLAARAEAVYTPRLGAVNEVPNAESPGEALLSLRGRYDTGLSWTGGAALPISKGASAAAYRVFLGVGYTFGKDPEPDTDGDGLVDSVDPCPTEPETLNDYLDDDGCPDSLADLLVTVVNEDGEPVLDGEVTVGEQTVTLDAQGRFSMADLMPGTLIGGKAVHPHYHEAVLAPLTLAEGPNEATLQLAYLPGKVRVITKSNTGAILDARVRFDGPASLDPENVGPEGSRVFTLRPGTWMVLVSAEAFGTERRELEINPGETSLVVIEVILHPTKTEVKEEEIVILEQVLFDFDRDTVQAASLPLLEEVANVLIDNPHLKKVEIQGHTDSRGDDEYNRDLSQRRVETVRRHLIEGGVAADRLTAVGYGEARPIASNRNEAGRARNRRVEFVILDPPPKSDDQEEGSP